ncbi:hypothetical protein PIB30_083348, partial [Stylosanthes scabra]|nr:hypothetical protein [Stylosanthes scabra]
DGVVFLRELFCSFHRLCGDCSLSGRLRVAVLAGSFVDNRDFFLHLPPNSPALCFYLLNMRFPTDGANVKVGLLNDCPKDLEWGTEPQ